MHTAGERQWGMAKRRDRETASGDDNDAGETARLQATLLSWLGGVVFATRVFPVKLLVDTDLRVCPISKYC